MVDPKVEQCTVGYDRRTASFPLRVKKTNFESSHKYSGLQLADILAGAITRVLCADRKGRLKDDLYARKLIPVLGEFELIGMRPESKVLPEDLGTIGSTEKDPFEFVGRIALAARESGAKKS